MSNLPKMLFASLILLAMSACAGSTTAPGAVSNYCAITQPITYDSTKDSPETVKQVEEHNSRLACVCDDDCPVKPERPTPPPKGTQTP